MRSIILGIGMMITSTCMTQNENILPFREIPEHPEKYTAGSVASRMVDGLGFRYYWATEGLRLEDLEYKPSESGRSTEETIDHILGLSQFILNALGAEINAQENLKNQSFQAKRKQTLLNFQDASDILLKTEALAKFDNKRFPFWNIINGPISDALWHCGQIVVLRRASGNPFNAKVSVFSGKLRE